MSPIILPKLEENSYYDQHLHSDFSYDSEQALKSYLSVTKGYLVTTEHFDLSNPVTQADDIPDFKAYFTYIAELNRAYKGRILSGVEIGYYAPREQDLLDLLAPYSFDLKLLSIHHNGQFDFLDEPVASMNFDQIFSDYLARLEEAIGRVPANILAHFDYGVRLFDLTKERLSAYENQLTRIFKKMIDHQLAFEINSKSIILYHHAEAYRYAIQLVKSLGGKLFSLGSDGHELLHYRLGFDGLYSWLKAQGITELTTFRGGHRYFIKI